MPPAPLLGAANIIIDQATLGPGIAGRSRTDGVPFQVVTLRNADNTNVLKWRWVLETPRGSDAVLSSPTSASCQYTPDRRGTYAVTLYVNEGKARTQVMKRLLGVKTEAGLRYPAQNEGAEANWTSIFTGSPNETGWWEDLIVLLQSLQLGVDGSLITVDAEAGLPTSRQLTAGSGIVLSDGGPGGALTIRSTSGVVLYLDMAMQAENILAARVFEPATRDVFDVGQVNLGSEVDDVSFGTRADYATIGGGHNNLAAGIGSTVAGGRANRAGGDFTSCIGGYNNVASDAYCTVAGGSDNTAAGIYAIVAGGTRNTAAQSYAGCFAGILNIAEGSGSVCIGGEQNFAAGDQSAIVGGSANQVLSSGAHIGGGSSNLVSGAAAAVVGSDNSANGAYALAVGRFCLANNDYSVTIGRSASSIHAGAHVIKDGTASTVQSSADNELTLSYEGGIRMLFPVSRRLFKSGYSGSNNFVEEVHGSVSTTDATPATSTIVTIPSGQDCHIKGVLKGKQTGTAAARVLFYEASYTNNGGAVALVGAALVNTANSAVAGSTWATAVNINGGTLEVAITGAAATTIRWTWQFEVSVGGAT